MKFKIELEIDDDQKLITIKDSREEQPEKQFKGGVHLVAADGKNKVYYVLSYGGSTDIGWGLAQAINDGWKFPFVKRMFFHFTEWINKFLVNVGDGYDINDEEDVKALDDILKRQEEQDKKNKIIVH